MQWQVRQRDGVGAVRGVTEAEKWSEVTKGGREEQSRGVVWR